MSETWGISFIVLNLQFELTNTNTNSNTNTVMKLNHVDNHNDHYDVSY